MAGLIETAMKDPLKTSANGADAFQIASTTGVDPVTRTVSPEETVAGQVDRLTKAESPLMQQAVAGATRAANARGLINSTMAVTAGQDAALRSVLPIASQDASTFTAAAQDNMGARNNAMAFNAGANNTTNATNVAALNQAARVKQAGDIQTGQIVTQGEQNRITQAQGIQGQKDLATLSGEINLQLQQLKGDQATNLTNVEANYKQLIQTTASAAGFYQTAMQMLTAIMADTNTSTEQKQGAVDRITGMLGGGLNVIGTIGNVDLGGLLNFS